MKKLTTLAITAALTCGAITAPAANAAGFISDEAAQAMLGDVFQQMEDFKTDPACKIQPPATPEKVEAAKKENKIGNEIGVLAESLTNEYTPAEYSRIMAFLDKIEEAGRVFEPFRPADCKRSLISIAQDGRKNMKKYEAAFGVKAEVTPKEEPKNEPKTEPKEEPKKNEDSSSAGTAALIAIPLVLVLAIGGFLAANPAMLPKM